MIAHNPLHGSGRAALPHPVGLGITQASLYAAFGSKEQLFHEAVDLYRRTAGLSTACALAVGSSAREAIHAIGCVTRVRIMKMVF
jgi:AcrR family transcriptional regulator